MDLIAILVVLVVAAMLIAMLVRAAQLRRLSGEPDQQPAAEPRFTRRETDRTAEPPVGSGRSRL
jgi:hypothetical protein